MTAAFAFEQMRRQADQENYRASMIAGLVPLLNDVIRHQKKFEEEVTDKLSIFDAGTARGEQRGLPIFRETDSERPPSRAWDGLVATGAANSLDATMYYRLSLFLTRQESLGERYVRYNDFTEQKVFTLGRDQSAMYDAATNQLRPETPHTSIALAICSAAIDA